jgi:hypothetical protein
MSQLDFNVRYNHYRYNDLFVNRVNNIKNADPGFQKNQFYKRNMTQKFSQKAIYEKQHIFLLEIIRILRKHKCNYKIIINPLYDQLKLSESDYQLIEQIFGKKNIYDFSGINYITNDVDNFDDVLHFKPKIGNLILKQIYTDRKF